MFISNPSKKIYAFDSFVYSAFYYDDNHRKRYDEFLSDLKDRAENDGYNAKVLITTIEKYAVSNNDNTNN